jgi:hypothetical protein
MQLAAIDGDVAIKTARHHRQAVSRSISNSYRPVVSCAGSACTLLCLVEYVK